MSSTEIRVRKDLEAGSDYETRKMKERKKEQNGIHIHRVSALGHIEKKEQETWY